MSIKKMLPLFHKLFGMMFAEMRASGMTDKQVDWYVDTLATLMSISIMDVYESKAEFDKLFNDIEKDYSKFESEILKPRAKA
tara:strand:+ start:43 stop:288 length:246 start_codon:yes stop_codon:yes gene_type:complete